MRVLHVCTELFPLLKTGGLADVIGALPDAQIAAGVDVRLILPAFPDVCAGITNSILITHIETFAGRVSLRYGNYQGKGIYLIDVPKLYERSGSPYHDQSLYSWPDNHKRFGLLGWIACEIACGLDSNWKPDIIHAHDWHAGLACAYLVARGRPARSIFTVHNLAYQGLFSAHHITELQLPVSFFQLNGLEFYGQLSFMKAGLFYADHITTVSPSYAREITQANFGYGMEGLLQQRANEGRLTGILNGVDATVWNPENDPFITAHYHRKNLTGKTRNKAWLQNKMGLQVAENALIFTVVSRLTEQKGLDLILEVLPFLLKQGGQLVVLGKGDATLQQKFMAAADRYPGQVAVQIGYEESLSHQIIAGADVILVPSRYEPCGLTQLYGLKYGTLPLVRRTGGLADTVIDCALENMADNSACGFVFDEYCPKALEQAIRRAFVLWKRPKDWRQVQANAMDLDFSWPLTAAGYLSLYKTLL